jgi:putative ABC transport system permease protein
MMGELILRNLLHRPLRTIIGILAIAVEVALVVLVVGLTSGILTETAKRVEGIGADILVQPSSAGRLMGMTNSPMPIKIKDRLEQLQYVQAIAPVLLQFNSTGGIELIYGIDKSFDDVSGGFVFLQGNAMLGPDDFLMDVLAAQ